MLLTNNVDKNKQIIITNKIYDYTESNTKLALTNNL